MLALLGLVLLPFFVIGGRLFVRNGGSGLTAAQIITQGRLETRGAHFGLGQLAFWNFWRFGHKKSRSDYGERLRA